VEGCGAVRCNHSDRLILGDAAWIDSPAVACATFELASGLPYRTLSLSRLPQASWVPFHASAVFPQDAVSRRNTRLRWAVFLSPLRLVRFARTADEIEVNLGSLDAPDQLMPTESWIVRRESWLPPAHDTTAIVTLRVALRSRSHERVGCGNVLSLSGKPSAVLQFVAYATFNPAEADCQILVELQDRVQPLNRNVVPIAGGGLACVVLRAKLRNALMTGEESCCHKPDKVRFRICSCKGL